MAFALLKILKTCVISYEVVEKNIFRQYVNKFLARHVVTKDKHVMKFVPFFLLSKANMLAHA